MHTHIIMFAISFIWYWKDLVFISIRLYKVEPPNLYCTTGHIRTRCTQRPNERFHASQRNQSWWWPYPTASCKSLWSQSCLVQSRDEIACWKRITNKIKWTNIYSWTTDRQRGHFCICNVAMVWIASGIPKGITGGGGPAQNSNDAEEASQRTTLGIRRGWICGATDFQLEQIEGCLRSNPRWDILYRARISKRNAWSLSWHKPNTQRHTRRSCIILRSISGHLRYNRYSKLTNRLKHFS